MTPAQLLHFEHQHPVATPNKHARIRHELGITETRYYVLLQRAAHHPDGIRAHPITARMIRERLERRGVIRTQRVAWVVSRRLSRWETPSDTLAESVPLTKKPLPQ